MSAEVKTCTKCGETKPLTGFYEHPTGKDGRQSRCKACQAESRRAWAKTESGRARVASYARSNYQAARKEHHAVSLSQYHAAQAKSLDAATNRGKEWTGPELELVADYSRSASQLASTLGRTVASIRMQRRRLHTDPRRARMAGTEVA